jgi:hypothetical protein
VVAILLRAFCVIVLIGAATASRADAPNSTMPFTGIPQVPKSLPLFGHADYDGVVLQKAIDRDPDGVAYAIAAGGSPDAADGDGRSALTHAAMTNAVAVARVLLDHGAQVETRDKLGDTALHWAAKSGSVDVIRLLLAAHATADPPDLKGVTPLMLAAGNNKPEAVRALLQGHADPKKTDYTGRDALGWADGHPRVITVLQTMTTER